MTSGRVLIVDDDADVREMLAEYLATHGYDVAQADRGVAMRDEVERAVPDVVLLDLALPGEDGLSLARYLREHYDVGVIMVTGAGELADRIVGLEIGADDYVAKPFDLRELRARVKSVMRRMQRGATGEAAPGTGAQAHRVGPLPARSAVPPPGRPGRAEMPLTAMEFDLLRAFVEHPHQVLSRDRLLTLTRNREWEPFDRSIDIRIARLRKKIEDDPEQPRAIRTVRGAGYMFVPQAAL